jgi:hypothetical protein
LNGKNRGLLQTAEALAFAPPVFRGLASDLALDRIEFSRRHERGVGTSSSPDDAQQLEPEPSRFVPPSAQGDVRRVGRRSHRLPGEIREAQEDLAGWTGARASRDEAASSARWPVERSRPYAVPRQHRRPMRNPNRSPSRCISRMPRRSLPRCSVRWTTGIGTAERLGASIRAVRHAVLRPACRSCGGRCHVKDWRLHQVATLFGAVAVRLPQFRCAGCGHTETGID